MKFSDIDLRKAVRTPHTYDPLSRYIRYGQQLVDAKSKEEVIDLLKKSKAWKRVDKTAFKNIDDLTLLKERLMFYWIAENIHNYYTKEVRRPGPKGDRIRRMFESIKTEPIDVRVLSEEFNVSYNIIKQHRRYDTCPEKGQTVIKKGMISRPKKSESRRSE